MPQKLTLFASYKTRLPEFFAAAAILSLFVAPTVQAAVTNGLITFGSDRTSKFDVYAMSTNGSDQTNLTNNSSTNDQAPSWSPDGLKVTFQSKRDGNWEIYKMNADGKDQTRLTNNSDKDTSPSWSPDGTKIAFHSNRDGVWEIYVMNTDGSDQTNLTNKGTANDKRATWSPDGSQIAFYSDRDGNTEIYKMNSDGTGQTRLTNDSDNDGAPSWSPNGTKIAFHSGPDGNDEIYTMNTDGSGQTKLTNASALNQRPVWSPDGTKIVFHSNREGNYEIYTMNTDGSEQTNISQAPLSDDMWPDWQTVTVADVPDAVPETTTPSTVAPFLTLSTPSFNTSKRIRLKRSTLYRRYLRNGFKGVEAGYSRIEAYYLLRVRLVRKKTKRGKGTRRVKRCYKLHRSKPVSCDTTTTNGITFDSSADSSGKRSITIRPLGAGKHARDIRKNLNRGKRIRSGKYDLAIRAYPATGGPADIYTYRFKVIK